MFNYLIEKGELNNLVKALTSLKEDYGYDAILKILSNIPSDLSKNYKYEGLVYKGLVVDAELKLLKDDLISSWSTDKKYCYYFCEKATYIEYVEDNYDCEAIGVILESTVLGWDIGAMLRDIQKYRSYISKARVVDLELMDIENEILATLNLESCKVVEKIIDGKHYILEGLNVS